jgi:hypothetical protein
MYKSGTNLCQLLLSSHRAYRATLSPLDARMRHYFVEMMPHCRLGDWAHILCARLHHIWVVGWEDSSRCAYDGAECIIHLLSLRLVDG